MPISGTPNLILPSFLSPNNDPTSKVDGSLVEINRHSISHVDAPGLEDISQHDSLQPVLRLHGRIHTRFLQDEEHGHPCEVEVGLRDGSVAIAVRGRRVRRTRTRGCGGRDLCLGRADRGSVDDSVRGDDTRGGRRGTGPLHA